MTNPNQCSKCKTYVIGTYCFKCDLDTREIDNPFPTGNPLDDFFGDFDKKEN